MQNVVLRAPALVFLVAVSAASGEDAACAATDAASQSLYSHAAATLTISTANPPATDMRVQIRGRRRLTYSSKDELPEFIGAPTDAAFPLVAHAGNLTEADAAPDTETAPTIADAFLLMYVLETACQIQIMAQSGGNELVEVPKPILAGIQAQAEEVTKGLGGSLVWPGLLRKLERRDPSFRN